MPLRWPSKMLHLAAGLFAVVWCVNVFRAATQAMTHDEALTWRRYLAEPLADSFNYYWTNHHILYTLLSYAVTALFGFSELSIRAVSVLGGALFFAGVIRLCRRLMGPTPLAAAIALIAGLNPFVLDFMVAARGYGLGLAFLVWAIDGLVGLLQEEDPLAPRPDLDRRLSLASVCLGISISANLIYLFPGTALAAAFVVIMLADGVKRFPAPERGQLLRRMVVNFALPGPLLAAAICGPVLRHADLGTFDMGLHRLDEAVNDLLRCSLWHHRMIGHPALQAVSESLAAGIAWGVTPLVCLLLLVAVPALAWRWRRGGSVASLRADQRGTLLLGGAALLTAAVYLATHTLLGVRYPDARASLWGVMLLTFLAPLLGAWVLDRFKPGPVTVTLRSLGWAMALAALALNLLAFNVSHFREWRYDAANRIHFEHIAQKGREAHAMLRLGASSVLLPSLNYYRDRVAPPNISRVLPPTDLPSFDLLVLQPGDLQSLENEAPGRFRVVERDELAETCLVERVR
ncbi:MAG: hypothetical protein NTW19_18690 [Planctomycetota bacterium]|nr:hypothetical protein [Planctomycetota bacterium]